MNNIGRPLRHNEAMILVGLATALLGIMLLHVYFFHLGIAMNTLLTFWVPLEVAGFLVFYGVLSNDDKWAVALVLIFAASLHLVVPLSNSPNYAFTVDAVYGYQKVTNTIASGRWVFGAGTGEAQFYSFFPLAFVFAAVWSEVASIFPAVIASYGIALVNLTTFLTLRLFNRSLLKLSEKQSNLVLFFYALTPTIHRVEASLHYEAYAIIFFPLVMMFILKPRLSSAERIVAVAAILSIAISHYFTSYILILNGVVIGISYLIFRGTRIQGRLLFLSIVAPLAWDGALAITVLGRNVLDVQSILSHLKNLSNLFSTLSTLTATSVATYYPAPWFAELAIVRNLVILVLGLIGILSLCIMRTSRFRFKLSRRDMYTYLAATWIFSVFFSLGAYYGVVWSETVLATQGPASARNRIAEFSFFNFSIFSGIGLFVIVEKLRKRMHDRKLEFTKVLLGVLLIFLFVTSCVVQAYPRVAYDSSYHPIFFDEYVSSFQAPIYLGSWWNQVANHTLTNSRPMSGSRSLGTYMSGYGYQTWWEDNLNTPSVNMNNSRSAIFTVYYAVDTLEIQKPDHLYNTTLSPQFVSSQNHNLDMIFNSGRLIVLVKPSPQ